MRNFQQLMNKLESLWAQNVYALYLHLVGGQCNGPFVDRQLVKIRNCVTINHIFAEEGLFEVDRATRLPEIREDDLINSIENVALPFIRSRQSSRKNLNQFGGIGDDSNGPTTVYRNLGCDAGRNEGAYQSVPQIVEGWLEELSSEGNVGSCQVQAIEEGKEIDRAKDRTTFREWW